MVYVPSVRTTNYLFHLLAPQITNNPHNLGTGRYGPRFYSVTGKTGLRAVRILITYGASRLFDHNPYKLIALKISTTLP